MIDEYPEIALERFDKANIWIKYIVLQIRNFMKDQILEVGAGCGSFTKSYMKKFKSITLTDLDNNSVKLLKKNFSKNENIKILSQTTREIQERFNTIIYFNVLEHVKDDISEINSALEKLNSGGYLIILVPAHQKIYSKLDKAVGHYKRYDIDFFHNNKFKNSKIVRLRFLDFFGYFLYHFNKIFFKEEVFPSNFKIFVWDKIFTPFTVIMDFLTRYKFGKNILCIYQKTN